ncbi:FUSC family protein [Alicyclobacillus cycloheptanicus]|uniref:Membrane protein YccC n=1 Tax=Alicyclobacillus cycloheptanicus TaxID=1457 RepID=A0ABT9XFE7_9BACL|nr:FUSC family protein [Alicyclobacillus cycloheptanicus]MDQ0189026.1 putative membrane protein YccC [Alicyclobacillus cycloheptanicus]WDM01636.1 FUSC family protein [Alicyclobacillus cycloheptanicus]
MISTSDITGAFYVRKAKPPWGKAAVASLTMGICMLAGAVLGHVEWGMLATTGGFASLYVHNESYRVRAWKLPLVTLGLAASLGLATLFAGHLWTLTCTLVLVSMAGTLVAGVLRLPPPGGYFFVLVCALGTGLPVAPGQVGLRVGLSLVGGAIAWLIAMAACLLSSLRGLEPPVQAPAARAPVRSVLPAVLRIGVGVLVATAIAAWLGNPRPYWVPLTCASVLQGATMVATMHRTIQRAAGTALGVLVAGAILALHPPVWCLIVCLMAFQCIAEIMIVRNYGLAVIAITPLPLILIESGYPTMKAGILVNARLLDTLLGCAIGIFIALLFRRHTDRHAAASGAGQAR